MNICRWRLRAALVVALLSAPTGAFSGEGTALPDGVFGFTQAARFGEPGAAVVTFGVTGSENNGMIRVEREASASVALSSDFALRFGGWSSPAGAGRVVPDGLSVEIAHRLWSNERFAATFAVAPNWSWWRELGGEAGDSIGIDGAFRLDGVLVPGRLFGAVNVGVSISREAGISFQDPSSTPQVSSQLDASAALAARLTDAIYVALEARLSAPVDGRAVSISAGPSLNVRLSEQATLSATFTPRLAASGGAEALDDLTEQRFQLELSVAF